MFIFLLVFLGCSTAAEAKIITFKLVNEFGVPQPIEVRQDFRDDWGVVGEEFKGFGQVTFPVDLETGDKVLITRKYSKSSGKSAPEGLGITYKVSAASPSIVTKTVPSIKTNYQIQQIKPVDRAILGLINNIRQENGLSRIHRVQALDNAASLWAQQIEGSGGSFVQNYNLMWNFAYNGFISYVNYSWNLNKKLIVDRFFNTTCPSYDGSQIPCKDVYLDPLLDNIAVASSGDVAWIFSLRDCQGPGCTFLEDSGDYSILDNPICDTQCQCQSCQGKKNPLLKVKKVFKNKRFVKVLISADRGVAGLSKMFLKQRNRSFVVKGKKTNVGFSFKVKKSSRFNPRKRFKARVVFYGNKNWQPARIKIK